LIILFIFSFPIYYRLIDTHLGLDLGLDAVKKTVNEAHDACLLIEVWVLIDVLQALKERDYDELDVFELRGGLYLTHRLLDDLHVLVVPFGLLGPLNDPALLLHEGFHWAKYALFGFICAVAQDLDCNLYIGLLYFVVNGLQDAREVAPIVDLSNHPLTRDCVFKPI
jgi:hypothetical protein